MCVTYTFANMVSITDTDSFVYENCTVQPKAALKVWEENDAHKMSQPKKTPVQKKKKKKGGFLSNYSL